MKRSVLILGAASALLLGLPAASARAAADGTTPAPGTTTRITLTASTVLDVNGTQDPLTLTGTATLEAGNPVTIDGHPAIPFLISGEHLTGRSPALGHVRMTLEGQQDAWLFENTREKPFPAEEVMPFNYHITLGAFPGETLTAQAIDPGPTTLVGQLTQFPPKGDLYQLQSPVDLIDVENPDTVVATIQKFPVKVGGL